MDSLFGKLYRVSELARQIHRDLDDLYEVLSTPDHTADWREYIQRPTVYAPPVADMGEVVQWMRERPGTTEPGQYPTASAEHAEAEAKLQSIRERQRVYDARHYAKRTLTTAAQ